MNLFKKEDKKVDNSSNLKLSDHENIWSKFCFLDETGSLNSPEQPFFSVGIIKMTQPYYLQSKILYERNKRNFHDEMHFNKLSKRNIEFAKFAIESFLDTKNTNFYSYSVDKQGDYFQREFHSDPWKAYEELTIRLLSEAVLAPSEILILIADHVTTPKEVRYEVTVKREMNNKEKRLAVAGVCRFDSKSNDLLQVVDLFLGAINYDLKIETGIVKRGDKYKRELLKFIKDNLGIKDNFIEGFRNRNFNIFVDKDMKSRIFLNEEDDDKEN